MRGTGTISEDANLAFFLKKVKVCRQFCRNRKSVPAGKTRRDDLLSSGKAFDSPGVFLYNRVDHFFS